MGHKAARPELNMKTEEGKINQLTPPEICPRNMNSLHFLFPLLLDTKSHARLLLSNASSKSKILVSLRHATILSSAQRGSNWVSARGVPSASKIEAKILKDFQLNLDHPGGKSGRESGSKPSGT